MTEAKMQKIVSTSTLPQSRTKSAPRSWRSVLTLDMILAAANKSILHPFVAWMLPLSLRAITIPYSHLSIQLTAAYASLLTLNYIFTVLSERIAFGNSRQTDPSEEVIVITGGGRGLGRAIADFYRMRGSGVVILDVAFEDELSGVDFYRCDVGNPDEVKSTYEKICVEIGIPTILINNAGVMIGKPILDLTTQELQRTINSNLLSHFFTVKMFLPGMLEEGRGTIVTVGSVLGHLGCANLADYSASKAALQAFHASLRAELEHSKHPTASEIKTIFVSPGQLATPMFSGVRTPSNFFAPIVEPIELAREIVTMINYGDSGEIMVPYYTKWISLFRALPAGLQKIFRSNVKMDQAMLNYCDARDKGKESKLDMKT